MVEKMTMRDGLENMIKSFEGGCIKHALLTTFNFDPGFFEKNVLPLLCGIPVDEIKSMSLDALAREMYHPLKKMKVVVAYDQAALQGVSGGVRYSFLPKHQENGFFHAKLIVLTGIDAQKKPIATVMVGSGNMTLSGWGSNIEVAAWIQLNQANAQELLGFYAYLNDPELKAGMDILEKIVTQEASPQLFLQYPVKNRGTLFERIFASRLSGDMHLFSPYWSEGAIKTFQSKARVYCYPALGNHGHEFSMTPDRASALGLHVHAIKAEERFRHAKAYFWASYMAMGSANCTIQALHSENNVEAMLLFEGYPQLKFSSEPLSKWSTESDDEEGIKPVPLDVLIIADYEKRIYRVMLNIDNRGRCESWRLRIAGIKLAGVAEFHNVIPFEKDKPVARDYRVKWEGKDGSQFMIGMVIPRNGNDVELGYRPKRNLDKIFQAMLRHKTPDESRFPRGNDTSNSADEMDFDVAVDDDLMQADEEYEFDMYGMYQSFYHLKKSFPKSDSSGIPEWEFEELSDTLQEILLAINDKDKGGEVNHFVQQWLILNEVMELAHQLPEHLFKRFGPFQAVQTELNDKLQEILRKDKTMQAYKITPENLLKWVREELGYECK